MKNSFLRTTLVPVLAIIICAILYLLDYFEIITATVLIIIASAIEYRKKLFASLGFQRKRLNAIHLLVLAPLVAIGLFILYVIILVPAATAITGEVIDLSDFDSYKGNLPASLILLAFIWTSAAFGEEIFFRGYLMRQFTKFFGSSKLSIILNIVLLGFLFGWIHSYQGITGQIVSGVTGVLLAIIFHLRKNDLWFNIAVHGFFDTIAVVIFYYGWY